MWRLARFVLLATTASAVSISAFAADLPARMEPVAPVAYVLFMDRLLSWGRAWMDTNEPQIHYGSAIAWGAIPRDGGVR